MMMNIMQIVFAIALLGGCSKEQPHLESTEFASNAMEIQQPVLNTIQNTAQGLLLVPTYPTFSLVKGLHIAAPKLSLTPINTMGQTVLQMQLVEDPDVDYYDFAICPQPTAEDAAAETDPTSADPCPDIYADGQGNFSSATNLVVDLPTGNYTAYIRGCVSFYHSDTNVDVCSENWGSADINYTETSQNDGIKADLLFKKQLEANLFQICAASMVFAAGYAPDAMSDPNFTTMVQNFMQMGIEGCMANAEGGILQTIETSDTASSTDLEISAQVPQELVDTTTNLETTTQDTAVTSNMQIPSMKSINPYGVFALAAGPSVADLVQLYFDVVQLQQANIELRAEGGASVGLELADGVVQRAARKVVKRTRDTVATGAKGETNPLFKRMSALESHVAQLNADIQSRSARIKANQQKIKNIVAEFKKDPALKDKLKVKNQMQLKFDSLKMNEKTRTRVFENAKERIGKKIKYANKLEADFKAVNPKPSSSVEYAKKQVLQKIKQGGTLTEVKARLDELDSKLPKTSASQKEFQKFKSFVTTNLADGSYSKICANDTLEEFPKARNYLASVTGSTNYKNLKSLSATQQREMMTKMNADMLVQDPVKSASARIKGLANEIVADRSTIKIQEGKARIAGTQAEGLKQQWRNGATPGVMSPAEVEATNAAKARVEDRAADRTISRTMSRRGGIGGIEAAEAVDGVGVFGTFLSVVTMLQDSSEQQLIHDMQQVYNAMYYISDLILLTDQDLLAPTPAPTQQESPEIPPPVSSSPNVP